MATTTATAPAGKRMLFILQKDKKKTDQFADAIWELQQTGIFFLQQVSALKNSSYILSKISIHNASKVPHLASCHFVKFLFTCYWMQL